MGAGLQPGGGLSNRRARRRSAAPMSETEKNWEQIGAAERITADA